MHKPEDLVQVEPIALLPTQSGCAVFLGDGDKAIVFYIEPSIGASINAVMADVEPPRPLSHDLINSILDGFGAKMLYAVIVKAEHDVFYARLILQAENEVQHKKIVELDARPSDCIALAVRQSAPIYFLKTVWETQRDMSDVLEDLRKQGNDEA
ncbi:bifunctional nuclease family protein [Persicirhabdus sediminis]|uniref:Bifunctional nuclease family protein n=1 Tax=Persicirhabdus sediminis TaxID=454144 RepID=A0A8J7MEP4_9BACT|nr:bifunctional nuclease family protein [Persicirhabdus sediminis]MBK1791303.1 bifunctional nuclease family protein [Persicirhabdus sediminis]